MIDQPPKLTAWNHGSLIQVTRRKYINPESPTPHRPRGNRSIITKFSRASRKRLLHTIGKLQRDTAPLFVTLTYPFNFPREPAIWKHHLKTWAARLKRLYPKTAFIWRLEFQKRGAPHFHLLVYGIDTPLQQLRKWVSISWYEVVNSNDNKHLVAGTNVQQMQSFRAIMGYASKELSKLSQSSISRIYPNGVGRWWGAYFRKELPWAETASIDITEKNAIRLIRFMRKFAQIKPREYSSLTILCDSELWFKKLGTYLKSDDQVTPVPLKPLAHLAKIEKSLCVSPRKP